MKITYSLLSLVFFLFFISNNAFSRVTHDQDASIDFSKFKSYSVMPLQEDSSSQINSIDRQRLQSALNNEMQSRGLELVDGDGDIKMSIYLAIKDQQSATAYTNYVGGYGYGLGVGMGMGAGKANTTVSENDYLVGTTLIDCYNESDKKLIWQERIKGILKKNQKREIKQFLSI